MLPRILEPEAMDTADEAAEYDAMNHSAVNEAFAADFLSRFDPSEGPAIDIGTGTALIPIVIAKRSPAIRLTAVDLSEEMLTVGRRNVANAGCANRIELVHVDAKGTPFDSGRFAAVISNSIIHHIPEPIHALREMVRICRPGGLLFIRDLFRPHTDAEVIRLVHRYAAHETPHQRQLFDQSLRAALTVSEIGDLVSELGFDRSTVSATSDRHWTWIARKPA